MNRRMDEKGAGLLEVVTAMPLIVMLLVALGTVFAFGVRSYLHLLGDWALQEQVSFAMERMTTDLRYAENAEIEGKRLRVFCRAASGPAQWVSYERTQETRPRMMRNNQPLTGQSTLGQIVLDRFDLLRLGERTIFLRLVGKNMLTGRTYELSTAVTWTGKGG